VNVDAAEHGTGDALLVFSHGRIGAGAGFDLVAVIAAWAGLHTNGHIFLFYQGSSV